MNKLLAILISGFMLTTSLAYAEPNETNNIKNQNLSRQPYKQTPAKDQTKGEEFEGATLIDESAETEKKARTLQLHRFDRRPHMQKSAD
jgi:hypothetical protein